MDHKGLDSLLISFQGVIWFFNESGNSYPNNINPTYINLISYGSSQKLDKNSG